MIAPFCQHPTPPALPVHRVALPTRMALGAGWGSWCEMEVLGAEPSPTPASRCGFRIAGKAQLPHLRFSAVRGWRGPWPPSLAEPLLHLPAPVSTSASFKRCTIRDTASVAASPFPGRKAPGLASCRASHQVMAKVSSGLQVYEKEENTQTGFVCLFASPLQREGPCYGAIMVSPMLLASLLCYKTGRQEPRITTHSMASGQSRSHYLHRVPSEVNRL